MANEIAMDLEELRHLRSVAKRPRVISFISNEIQNLEKVRLLSSSITSFTLDSSPSYFRFGLSYILIYLPQCCFD